MKISILLPSLAGGGVERMSLNLAEDWLRKGHEVEFVLLENQGELVDKLPSGASLQNLGSSRLRWAIPGLCRHLKASRPDVILSRMWPLTVASAMAWFYAGCKGRLFLSEHNHLSSERSSIPFLLKLSLRVTYPYASGIIAVSRGVKDDLLTLTGLADDKIRVIYNPVLRQRVDAAPRAIRQGNGPKRIITLGRLVPQKNHALLLRALKELRNTMDVSLTLYGEGPSRQALESLVSELGLGESVALPGYRENVDDCFRNADLFVLSSDHEGFGNVLVEALAHGIPIVSTDCPSGPAEILNHGEFGTLVRCHDPQELARAMRESLISGHAPERLMVRANDFTVEKISDEYLDYFMSVQK